MPDIEHLKGLDLIVEERLRQVGSLGYDLPHDDIEHTPEELLRIGSCYIEYAANEMEGLGQDSPHPFWPQGTSIPWKPEASPMETAIKGAAFVAAALDLMHYRLLGGDV